jgi:hypothetical protein
VSVKNGKGASVTNLHPVIDFQHVLKELSVNRNDPCEVIRELVSNAYDARADEMRLSVISDKKGFIFSDNGTGLSRTERINDITPYEAFFSIGKSTKTKGDGGVGYKCQGSKLCFAASRILVLTKCPEDVNWYFKIIENPRNTLSPMFDISPSTASSPDKVMADFFVGVDALGRKAVETFDASFFSSRTSGTLIAVIDLDAEGFSRYFAMGVNAEKSYLYNYIRHYTRHGDTTFITKDEGFSPSDVKQVVTKGRKGAKLSLWCDNAYVEVPYGFPYLPGEIEKDVKGPLEVARLRDGRFTSRAAKRINFGGQSYSFILAVDGNRRAHDGYEHLDRKGATKSGIRLSDQRGLWVSANGIKISRFNDILGRTELEGYAVLSDSEGSSHYHIIIDGDFELVTNRNAVSRSATSALDDSSFVTEFKKFLDGVRDASPVFKNLLLRLRREQTDARLNQQIEMLDESKRIMKSRERFEILGRKYVSPLPGEEYLVGVLYAELRNKVDETNLQAALWKTVLTFSTLGIDTIATENPKSFKDDDLIAIEYKYAFSSLGPFNHALCIVDYIVAWDVELKAGLQVRDDYGCFGDVAERPDGHFTITDIENVDGDSYNGHQVTVVCLKKLIKDTFVSAKFVTPPPK